MESLLDDPWVLGLLTALLLAGVVEAGCRAAVPLCIQKDEDRKGQTVAIRDGLFILLGLLFGFTLALAGTRYAERRSLLIDEATSIGTTYLRAETLPDTIRDQAQQMLKQYVDARLDLDNAGLDDDRRREAVEHAEQLQLRLWKGVIELTKSDRSAVTAAYMNSLNQTIDLHEKRISALENRVPRPIWLLIFCVSIIAVFTRGLTLARRFWLMFLLAPLTTALLIAFIADVDTPSSGLIQLDQRAMLRLKAEINSHP